MTLYWFWFLFPTISSIALTTHELFWTSRHPTAQPRFGLIFFLFLGLPALIPGWTVIYSGAASGLEDVVTSLVTPEHQKIVDVTVLTIMTLIIVIHCLSVLVLIPVQLTSVFQRITPRKGAG